MALLDCQGIRLILSISETTEFDHPSSIIYYKVDDIQQAYQTLIANGVTLIGQPHIVGTMGNSEFWMSFFRDPRQNVLAITSKTLINKDEI